jgi:glycerol-3-phosphate dehydrogenase
LHPPDNPGKIRLGSAREAANAVIIGGGVVGCAIALALASRWDDVFLLEQMPKLGMGASSRNSGVFHSGLYYPPGSLRARHAVGGNRLTCQFCAAHSVPHRRTGKLVVALGGDQIPELEALLERGRANGVDGLCLVDRARIRAREPHTAAAAAIEAPSAGIVAAEELVKAYARVAAAHGAHFVTNARGTAREPSGGLVRVVSTLGEIHTRCLVNSAGVFADEVAALLGNTRYRIYPVRGEYCELIRAKSDWVRALVYPLPHPAGLTLGVHLTRTLWESVLVGPTARSIAGKNDYERDREPLETFFESARLLLPEIQPSDLVPSYSGIRAKLSPPGSRGPSDFVIERDPEVPAAIHLVGIESPGLTAAPSIAEQVAEMAGEVLAPAK